MDNRPDQDLLEYLFSLTPSELADKLSEPGMVEELTRRGLGPDPEPTTPIPFDVIPENRRGLASADEVARRNRKRLGL